MTTEAILSSHVNSDIVTREQLAAIAPPQGTDSWRPIAHIELVEGLDKAARGLGLAIQSEQWAIRRDGLMLFGVLKIVYRETGEFITSLGVRHANNRSMSIQICAGASVFVCDNLVFRGDFICLKQRHVWGFDLNGELTGAMSRWRQHADRLIEEVEVLKAKQLSDVEAKALICDVFSKGIMPIRLLPAVVKDYFEPQHEQFTGRNAWSLHNAFTEVQKTMPITTRIVSSQELGRFFGMIGNGHAA